MSFKNTDIGLIPSEWDFDTIGDSLYIKGRIGWKGLKKSEYIDRSDYRIINGSNVVNNNIDWSGCGYISEERYEESPEIMLKPNDIVMTKDGTIGKLAIIRSLEQKTTVASGLFVIRVEDNSIDVDYLYYYFSSFYFKELVKSRIEGSVIPHLYQKDLVALKLPLPDLSEQKAISKILRTLDDKIEVNNQINRTLEDMSQAIFKQWFVDFEFPNEDGEPYKSSGGEMVESELGMIPKGWEVKGLDEIAEFLNGLAMQKFRPEENEKAYPVLKIKELRQGRTDESSDLCSSNIDEKYIVRDGDIIFSWSGSLLVDIWCGGNCGLNQHLFKVTSDKFDGWFVYQWNKYHLDRFVNIAKSKATTMGHIKRKDLSDSKVLIPSDEIYLKAAQHQKYLFEKIKYSKIEMKRLEEIRDALLPKLMSGKIRVPLDSEGDAS